MKGYCPQCSWLRTRLGEKPIEIDETTFSEIGMCKECYDERSELISMSRPYRNRGGY